MLKDIPKDLKSIRAVLVHKSYLSLIVGISLIVLVIMIWLPNFSFISTFVLNGDISLLSKAKFLWSSLGAFDTNFSLYSQITSIIIALLVGINVSLLAYYFRNRIALQKAAGTGAVGVLAGFLGIGCSACGSILLSTILGVGASSALFALFPYNGAELSIISILLLGSSILYVARSLNKPITCEIKRIN